MSRPAQHFPQHFRARMCEGQKQEGAARHTPSALGNPISGMRSLRLRPFRRRPSRSTISAMLLSLYISAAAARCRFSGDAARDAESEAFALPARACPAPLCDCEPRAGAALEPESEPAPPWERLSSAVGVSALVGRDCEPRLCVRLPLAVGVALVVGRDCEPLRCVRLSSAVGRALFPSLVLWSCEARAEAEVERAFVVGRGCGVFRCLPLLLCAAAAAARGSG